MAQNVEATASGPEMPFTQRKLSQDMPSLDAFADESVAFGQSRQENGNVSELQYTESALMQDQAQNEYFTPNQDYAQGQNFEAQNEQLQNQNEQYQNREHQSTGEQIFENQIAPVYQNEPEEEVLQNQDVLREVPDKELQEYLNFDVRKQPPVETVEESTVNLNEPELNDSFLEKKPDKVEPAVVDKEPLSENLIDESDHAESYPTETASLSDCTVTYDTPDTSVEVQHSDAKETGSTVEEVTESSSIETVGELETSTVETVEEVPENSTADEAVETSVEDSVIEQLTSSELQDETPPQISTDSVIEETPQNSSAEEIPEDSSAIVTEAVEEDSAAEFHDSSVEAEVVETVEIHEVVEDASQQTYVIGEPVEGDQEIQYAVVYNDMAEIPNGDLKEQSSALLVEGDMAEIIDGSEMMHLADSEVVIMPNDQQMIVMETNSFEEELPLEEEPKKKHAKDPNAIPEHVMGRDISKPCLDSKTGRPHAKPRLGVKVPSRNLTSQIVSKQEIADKIMERSRLRQSNADPPAGGDLFFTKKLTQRLAEKLLPGSKEKNESPPPPPPKKVVDNSDLIALLEGDDVPEFNLAKQSEDQRLRAQWEREVALRQLKELPIHSRRGRQRRGEEVRVKTEVKRDELVKPKVEPVQEEVPEPKPKVDAAPSTSKDPEDEIEPRFSSTAVVKTYTRKRKPFIEEFRAAIVQSIKKPTAAENIDCKPPTASPHTLSIDGESSSDKKKSKSPVKPDKAAPAKVKSPEKASNPKLEKSKTSQKDGDKAKAVDKPKVPEKLERKAQKDQSKVNSAEKKIPIQEKKNPSSAEKKTPILEKRNLALEKRVSAAEKAKLDKKPEKPLPTAEKAKPLPKPEATPEKAKNSKPPASTDKPKEIKVSKAIAPPPPPKPLSPNTYISKSSRIIKRKKIWDPDEATPIKIKSPKIEPKLEPDVELPPPKRLLRDGLHKTQKLVKKAKIISSKAKRRLTEVDKLLMDEGAVNMLYSVKNTEEMLNIKQKKKSVISLDRVQKELMNRTNELKNDLQSETRKDSPISLRKKDVTPKSSPVKEATPIKEPQPVKETIKDPNNLPREAVLQRKKSKDSATGSVHSPPASPAFAFGHADASRIIRRHSSSSFSSDAELEDRVPKKEPPKKKKKPLGVDRQVLNAEMAKKFNRSEDPTFSKFKSFSIVKFEQMVQLVLTPQADGHTVLSNESLNELSNVLNLLEKDDQCRVVLLSSSGHSFCEGLNYKKLVNADETKRINVAEKTAASIMIFLMTLAKFSKLIVAGIQGETIGLGVTMLPLFDMVLASDSATFNAPYARLGCVAEGTVVLRLPHIMHNALASELFYASRTLTASEALRLGLVTRTLWPDKFQEELVSSVKNVASRSAQSMQAIKKQFRESLLTDIEEALEAESSLLLQHWTSAECQKSFATYSLAAK